MQTKLSIIVPYYNVKENWLTACLLSILNAAKANPNISFFVHIIDDHSPAPLPSMEFFTKALPKNASYQITRNPKNLGLAGARNAGLNMIPSDHYVLFLDGDDLLVHVPKLDSTSIIAGNHILFGAEEHPSFSLPSRSQLDTLLIYSKTSYLRRLALRNMRPVSAYFVKRSIIGDIKFRENLSSCEDWCFWIELFQKIEKDPKASFALSSALVGAIRKSSSSMSAQVMRIYKNRKAFWSQIEKDSSFLKHIAASNELISDLLEHPAHLSSKKQRFELLVHGFWICFLSFIGRVFSKELLVHLTLVLSCGIHPAFTRQKLEQRYIKRAAERLQSASQA